MKVIVDSHKDNTLLPFAGSDVNGNKYQLTRNYFMKNGKPILPIMGEFHYSRYIPEEWEEELLKMKAGGIQIVSTYVFWIHHEEKKDEWDFSGCRDIRQFLQLCKKVDIPVWLRIGPWAHGECRNGGFPDWLVEELGHNGLFPTKEGKSNVHEARTDDPLYLCYVEKFWERLAQETKGMMLADGGPVLGIQLENEYCHAGGPSDIEKGYAHMKTLKRMAMQKGFLAPFYTTTAWGGGIVLDDETIPVLGGYVDAPWAGHNEEMPACENFIFRPYFNDENIGTDLKIEQEERVTYSKEKYPFLTAELGGGLQVTGLRRTYPFCEDTEAQAICMLGAGASLLGYYMYHGGVNPEGKYSTMQESIATGYFNDLPEKSYDFQTCIRENGKINPSFHALKKYHIMMNSFCELLAKTQAFLPIQCPSSAEDMETPRICIRYDEEQKYGFIFINNHQRLRTMNPIQDLNITIETKEEMLQIMHLTCETDVCAVIPFGIPMGNSKLVYTNLSILTKIGERYFFYSHNKENIKPQFIFEDQPYDNIVILSREEAQHAYQFGNTLYISEKAMFMQDDSVWVLSDETQENIIIYEETGDKKQVTIKAPVKKANVSVISQEIEKGIYELTLENAEKLDVHELFLHIDFGGDRAQLYEGERLLTDWFSNGEEWVVALKRYHFPKKLILKIYPFDETVYYDLTPKKGCELKRVFVEPEYKIQH